MAGGRQVKMKDNRKGYVFDDELDCEEITVYIADEIDKIKGAEKVIVKRHELRFGGFWFATIPDYMIRY